MTTLTTLLKDIRSCTLCAAHLPAGPRPVVQVAAGAKILLVGQAPGRKVHASGIPFDDASGDRLRAWMGVSKEVFYDAEQIAIVPMGFCYPGTGKSGDLPPRPECAVAWRERLLSQLRQIELTIVIGQYAMAYHLPQDKLSVTDAVSNWQDYAPAIIPLPHPSPRNQMWIKRHPWFESDLLPVLRQRVQDVLAS
jgi:uracil-DNA glycosylase